MNRKVLLLVVLLTVYAPIELTRLIIIYGIDRALLFELTFMWFFYISGMTLARLLIN